MHILFVHQAYPAQFGPMAEWMARSRKHRVTFLSADPNRWHGSIENIRYQAPPEPRRGQTIPWPQEFEQKIQHCLGVLTALKKRPDIRPDLIVGHSGFGSTLLVPEVRDCPIVNYFEYYVHPRRHDLLERKDLPPPPDWFGSWRRAANTMFLLDLETCRAGYSPTHWQRNFLPRRYRSKVRVLFDGIDTRVFRSRPRRAMSRVIGKASLPRGVRVVSYVARGLEAIRGFDLFLRVAKRIYREYPNVLFVVAGRERAAYASDIQPSGERSFKQWALRQDSYDLSKFRFVGWLPTPDLVRLFHLTDLHIYLTTPFPLSWSLFQAMACGATVLASDTAPVRELVAHQQNGVLANLLAVDALAKKALKVLRAPAEYRELGTNAAQHIREHYSIDVTAPRLLEFFEQHANAERD